MKTWGHLSEGENLKAMEFLNEESNIFADEIIFGQSYLVQYGINTGDENPLREPSTPFARQEKASTTLMEKLRNDINVESRRKAGLPDCVSTRED